MPSKVLQVLLCGLLLATISGNFHAAAVGEEEDDSGLKPISSTSPSSSSSSGNVWKYSSSLTPDRMHTDFIRCKVCNRAIAHIWHKGDALRRHCFQEGTDPRCDFSNLHSFGIEEMVHDVCEDLPLTHTAIHESEFDLVLAENPDHPEYVSSAIKTACQEWVHGEHGAEQVALYLYANLDAGKPTEVILHNLQHRFCRRACDPKHVRRRDRHDSDRQMRHKQHKEQLTEDARVKAEHSKSLEL